MRRAPGLQVTRQYNASPGGSTGAWIGEGLVYLKGNEPHHPYKLANEYIAGRLAAALGIPCPPGDIVELYDGKLGYGSLGVLNHGQTVAPPDIYEVGRKNPNFAAGVLVFDEWIINPDRNDENVIWWPGRKPYIIDHEKALFGTTGNIPSKIALRDKFVTGGHPFRSIVSRPNIVQWCLEVERLSSAAVRSAIEQARSWQLITETQSNDLMATLFLRKRDIRRLVLNEPATFPGTLFGEEET